MRALLAVCLLGACELIADIPNATPASSDGGGSDAAPRCTDSAQCAAPTPACFVEEARCVECVANADCTAVGAPICADHTCGGCIADGECASNVCLMDGTCAEAARFVYAASAGTGADCTSAQPCSVDTAVTKLTTTQDIVKLAPGVYARTTDLTMTLPGTLAGGGSTFSVGGPIGTVGITAMGVPIEVVGLTMNVATDNSAVRCQAAGGELHLARMRVTGGNGAIFSSCPTEVDRIVMAGASLYSLYVTAQPVQVRNSYFIASGSLPDYPIAAVHLQDVPSGTVEHTTIANNTAEGPSGLRCPGSAAVQVRNIISWGNVAPGIDPTCVVANSIVEPGYTGGTANSSVDPRFVDVPTNNFHLMPASPAAGLGDPAAMFAIDSDGETRPQPAGSAPDPGADEIP